MSPKIHAPPPDSTFTTSLVWARVVVCGATAVSCMDFLVFETQIDRSGDGLLVSLLVLLADALLNTHTFQPLYLRSYSVRVSAPSEALIRQETDQTKTKTTNEGCVSRGLLPDYSWVCETAARPRVTTAHADHCRTLKAIGSAEDSCCALDRLQWVRNGLTLTTADDYNSKVLSERGGTGQRVGYTKTGLRASPNRITQNITFAIQCFSAPRSRHHAHDTHTSITC